MSTLFLLTVGGAYAVTPTVKLLCDYPYSNNVLLLPADGYSTARIAAQATGATTVTIDYDGQAKDYTVNAAGKTDYLTVGPSNVTGDQTLTAIVPGALPQTLTIRYVLKPEISLTATPAKIGAGDLFQVRAKATRDGLPLADANISLTVVLTNNEVKKYYLTTDTAGQTPVLNITSSTNLNVSKSNLILAQVPSLSLMRSTLVTSNYTEPNRIDLIEYYPGQSVLADGTHTHLVFLRLADIGGNPIPSYAPVHIQDEYGNVINQSTNENGVIKFRTMPSIYTGTVNYTVYTDSGVKNSTPVYVNYVSGDPAAIEIKANPDIIASSDVTNKKIPYDIHQSQITVKVTDAWYHALPNSHVLLNTSNGTLASPAGANKAVEGYTNDVGEFYTTFTLDDFSNGTGTVKVNATCDDVTPGLYSDVSIRYTNESHLNITTSVFPRMVKVNDTVNVTVTIDGVGWQAGRQPVDLMFVIDRSGSMGELYDATYDTRFNATTVPPDGLYHEVGVFDNTRQNSAIFRLEPWSNTSATTGAYCVSDTIPDYMRSGTAGNYQITLQNTGTIPWSGDNQFRLAGLGDASTFTSPAVFYLPPGKVVDPGETYTFDLALKAPTRTTAYKYTPVYQMQWGNGGFNYAVAQPITVTPDLYATYRGQAGFDDGTVYLAPGTTAPVSITMQNTGTTPWTGGTTYSLGCIGPAASSFGPVTVFIPAGKTVNPDEYYTFTYPNFKTPSTYGIYELKYRMKQGSTYFGDESPPLYVAVAKPLNATFGEDTMPSEMRKSTKNAVRITVKNTGTTPWVGGSNFNLAGPSSFGYTSQYLPAGVTVNPGDDYTFSFELMAPSNRDTYWLQFQMAQGSARFGELKTYEVKVRNTVGRSNDYGATYEINDTYQFRIYCPDGTTRVFSSTDLNWFNNYTTSGALAPGQYKISVKRTISGLPDNYNDYELWIYNDMKLGEAYDRDSATKVGARFLIDRSLKPTDRAGMSSFSDYGSLDARLLPLTGDNKANLLNTINRTYSQDYTNTSGGLLYATEEIAGNPRTDGARVQKIEVLLTDGWDNRPYYSRDRAELNNKAIVDAKRYGIKVYTIGVGNTNTTDDLNLEYLMNLSSQTGGKYYYARSSYDIISAFDEIGQDLQQNVTTSNSQVFLGMEKITINATTTTNLSYVNKSAWTMVNKNPSTVTQIEPVRDKENDTVSYLQWNVSSIRLAENWTLTYQLKATQKGYTYPIDSASYGLFEVYNSSTPLNANFHSDYVLVVDNLTDNMTEPDFLNLTILLPTNNTKIEEGWVTLFWNVKYDNIDHYSQAIEYAPEGSEDYKVIATGFEGNATRDFTYQWDVGDLKLPPGKYKVRIKAADPLFVSQQTVYLNMDFLPGTIRLTSNSTQING